MLRKRWKLDWKKINSAQRLGTFNVYNFSKNQLRVIEHNEMSEDLLVACVTLPMWFAPVTIDGDSYIDGVYLTDANLMEAIRRGAVELWIVWTVSRKAQWKGGFIDTYFQIIETTANGHLKRDLDRIEASNTAIAEGQERESSAGRSRSTCWPPRCRCTTSSTSPRPSSPPPSSKAWPMRGPGRRGALTLAVQGNQDLMALTFREKMEGPFALGVSDPEEGRKKGLAGAPRLPCTAISTSRLSTALPIRRTTRGR